MRILVDQSVPVPLRRQLAGHSVDTAAERGWETLSNGDLPESAGAEGYELLVTTDQSLRYQQRLADRPFGIVVLMTTAWPDIQRGVEAIRDAIDATEAGELREVEI